MNLRIFVALFFLAILSAKPAWCDAEVKVPAGKESQSLMSVEIPGGETANDNQITHKETARKMAESNPVSGEDKGKLELVIATKAAFEKWLDDLSKEHEKVQGLQKIGMLPKDTLDQIESEIAFTKKALQETNEKISDASTQFKNNFKKKNSGRQDQHKWIEAIGDLAIE